MKGDRDISSVIRHMPVKSETAYEGLRDGGAYRRDTASWPGKGPSKREIHRSD